jgi:hypothetical protein
VSGSRAWEVCCIADTGADLIATAMLRRVVAIFTQYPETTRTPSRASKDQGAARVHWPGQTAKGATGNYIYVQKSCRQLEYVSGVSWLGRSWTECLACGDAWASDAPTSRHVRRPLRTATFPLVVRTRAEGLRRRNRSSDCCDDTGVLIVAGRAGGLLAACLDQPLDELVDVARLGQVPLGELVAQLGLGQALLALAGLVMGLPGLLALGTTPAADSAWSRTTPVSVPATSTHLTMR